jgi:hypothetical protein
MHRRPPDGIFEHSGITKERARERRSLGHAKRKENSEREKKSKKKRNPESPPGLEVDDEGRWGQQQQGGRQERGDQR